MAQKIIPNIWFNGTAREAFTFYERVFPDARIVGGSQYPNTAEEGLADFQLDLAGKDLTVDLEIGGYRLSAINAGPEFTPNPALSFMVNFEHSEGESVKDAMRELWDELRQRGKVLMPLDTYPFSELYGWVEDAYGVSWQLHLNDADGEMRPRIMPSLLFGAENANRAQEAINLYTSLFKDARIGTVSHYEEATGPAQKGAIQYADFTLEDCWFVAMDSGVGQTQSFTEGVSLAVLCEDQAEIDYLWSALSKHPENEQCGWCKDAYGVSWQIVPKDMDALLQKPGAYKNMMEMKKIVINDL